MKETIRYAHCIKFTPGQLDAHPFSEYQLRQVEVDILPLYDENDETEWKVQYNGGVIACEKLMRDACAVAAYELMNQSRDVAYHAFSYANKCRCGEVLIPPAVMCGQCSLNYHSA